MQIERIAPPTAEPVAVADLVAQARIDGAEENELLGRLLATARAHVESVTQRSLLRQDWCLTLDEFPTGAVIRLPRGPVSEVLSVKYLDALGQQQTLPASAYRLVKGGLVQRLVPAVGLSWPQALCDIGAVEVSYRAGWATAQDVPEEIRDAILMLAAHWFENREAVAVTKSNDGMMPVSLGFESLLSHHVVPWVV